MKKIFAETERLILREIVPEDALGILELDSDPEVHLYVPDRTIETIDEAKESINDIREQYEEFGIGRWAVIEKETGKFTGWAGLKWNVGPENDKRNFYDLGYRLIRRYWGKGYALEASKASITYGFGEMKLAEIIGVAERKNIASVKILERVGMKLIETFYEDDIELLWFSIRSEGRNA
jgi:RimJ/RimL family protein N-acetyltransferase